MPDVGGRVYTSDHAGRRREGPEAESTRSSSSFLAPGRDAAMCWVVGGDQYVQRVQQWGGGLYYRATQVSFLRPIERGFSLDPMSLRRRIGPSNPTGPWETALLDDLERIIPDVVRVDRDGTTGSDVRRWAERNGFVLDFAVTVTSSVIPTSDGYRIMAGWSRRVLGLGDARRH